MTALDDHSRYDDEEKTMNITEKIKAKAAEIRRLRENPHLEDLSDEDLAAAAEFARAQASAARSGRLRAAEAELKALEAAQAAGDRAVTDHEAAMKEHAAMVASSTKALDGSRARLTKAAQEALAAMQKLQGTAVEHRALVEETSSTLSGLGLHARYEDFHTTVDFTDAGAGPKGSVVLGGTWWKSIDAVQVVEVVLYALWRGAVGEHHVTTLRHRHVGRSVLEGTGLLNGLKLPDPFMPRPQEWLVEHRAVVAELLRGPAPSQAAQEAYDRQREQDAQQAKRDRESAMRVYGVQRHLLVTKHGEDRVRQLEAEHFPQGKPFGHSADWWAKQPLNERHIELVESGRPHLV